MSGPINYVVKQGDCLSSIAKEYGFTWQKLWDYGPNASLKQLRKNPNILMPGDKLVIPPLGERKESKAIDQHHKFKRKREQSVLRLRVLVDFEPVKNQPLTLIVETLKRTEEKKGKTDGDGHVLIDGSREIKIPGDAKHAELRVGDGPTPFVRYLHLGELSPHDQLLGVQQRLNNLGYHAGPEDGIMGPQTRAAVVMFQTDHKLKVDGIPGSQTQSKLKELHGS